MNPVFKNNMNLSLKMENLRLQRELEKIKQQEQVDEESLYVVLICTVVFVFGILIGCSIF